MKRILAAFMAIVIFFSILSINAAAEEPSAETSSDSSVLYNLQTKSFIVEKNADDEIFCGFLPRLMICVLLVESGEDLETEITVAENTRKNTPQYSSADIKDGERISLGDLMNAVLVGNSQEASVALAFHLSEDGTLESVIKKINEKAEIIGAENTVFTNVTGYYDSSNPGKTTARDVAIICSYAIELDYILDRSDITFTMLTVDGVTRPLYTRNSMIESASSYYYRRATGLGVSGDTNGGYSAASTILNNNSRFLAVNFSKTGLGYVLTDTVNLLKYALEAYEIREIVAKNAPVTEVEVRLGRDADYAVLYAENSVTASLPKSAEDEDIVLQFEDFASQITAPVEPGDSYGFAVYYYNDTEVGRTRLIARTTINLDLIAYYSDEIGNLFKNPLLWAAIIVVIILLVTYLIMSNISKSNKNKDEKIRRKNRIHGKIK